MLRRSPAALFVPLFTSLCLALSLATTSLAMGQHQKKRDYKRQVEKMEQQWRVAQIAGDVPAMDHLLADDYVGISINGDVNNKTQQLDRLRTRSLVVSRIDFSDMKVKLVGPVAVVTALVDVVGMNNGVPLNGQYRYTRVYQRFGTASWKITNFELTRVPRRHAGRLQADPNDAPVPPPPGNDKP